MARRRSDVNELTELTDQEIAFLRRESTPLEVKHYLARSHGDIGVRAAAYRKVAQAARAEAEAIFAVRTVAALKGETCELADLQSAVVRAADDRRALEEQNRALRERVQVLTALPALAVHSDD